MSAYRALGKQLGINTIPLREAIQRLTSEGLVEHIPNAGAFVRKIDRREIIQLFELRNALEMFSLQRAVSRIDDDQLEQLDRICAQWRQMARSMRDRPNRLIKGKEKLRWIGHVVKFHNILVDASGNVWLKKVAEDLRLISHIALSKPREMKVDRAARNYRIHAIVEPGSQADPKFQTPLAFTRVTAKAVRARLLAKGQGTSQALPAERTVHDILNRLGDRLRRARKTKPQKNFPKPRPSSSI